MTALPRELRKLREWIEAQRPYSDQTLEEALTADTAPLMNPARAMAERDFQGGVAMLTRAIREGKVSVRRPARPEPEPEPVDPHDPPVHFRPARIAQRIEHGASNAGVAGSNPAPGASSDSQDNGLPE